MFSISPSWSLEAGSFTEPESRSFDQANGPTSSQDPPVSVPQHWGHSHLSLCPALVIQIWFSDWQSECSYPLSAHPFCPCCCCTAGLLSTSKSCGTEPSGCGSHQTVMADTQVLIKAVLMTTGDCHDPFHPRKQWKTLG